MTSVNLAKKTGHWPVFFWLRFLLVDFYASGHLAVLELH